jgi:hydroxymethylpyrimidine pyrophosphatase-like HAD family hydrolase
MVVSDIDGTLLNSDSLVSAAVVDAVLDARKAGVIFTLATGRRYITTQKVLEELRLLPLHEYETDFKARGQTPALDALHRPPVIVQTGAVIVSADGHDLLFRDPLPEDDARRALRILVEAGLQPIVYEDRVHEQHLLTGPERFDSAGASQYLSSNPHLVVRVPYEELIFNYDPLQIAVIDRRELLEPIMERLDNVNCRTLLSYSGILDSCFMEVFHIGCNKARAVERLANYLGFGIADTVCIGDNWNDVEMLAQAGCGIAVANAEVGVAPYARRVTVSNDEDAVAVVLREILAGVEPGRANPTYGALESVEPLLAD